MQRHCAAFDPKRTSITPLHYAKLNPVLSFGGAAMRRREFVTLLGGTVAAWPLAAGAQKPEQMRRIIVLVGLDEKDAEAQRRAKAFRLGMRDLGWTEGRNIQIEIRFTESNLESINKHVAEVTRLAPDVIVANSTPVVAALRTTKSTIPIVFAMVNDPVGQDLFQVLHTLEPTLPVSISLISKWWANGSTCSATSNQVCRELH